MSIVKRLLIPISKAYFAWLDKYDALRGYSTGDDISIEGLLELQSKRGDGSKSGFVLVDVRSDSEQSVSMIPGAISKQSYDRALDEHRDKTVVAYCTAGGRSYLYARKLARRNIHARNLTAGIVGWCNAGGPLQTPAGEPTNRVHVDEKVFPIPESYIAV